MFPGDEPSDSDVTPPTKRIPLCCKISKKTWKILEFSNPRFSELSMLVRFGCLNTLGFSTPNLTVDQIDFSWRSVGFWCYSPNKTHFSFSFCAKLTGSASRFAIFDLQILLQILLEILLQFRGFTFGGSSMCWQQTRTTVRGWLLYSSKSVV